MSLKARRELLASTAVRYPKTSKKEKQTILDEFTASLTPLTLIALLLVGLVWKIVAVSWNEYSCSERMIVIRKNFFMLHLVACIIIAASSLLTQFT